MVLCPDFTEDEYEEFYSPGAGTKWTFHVFSMKDEKAVQLDDKIAEAQASVNGEELVFSKEKDVYTTSFEKAYQSKKPGTEIDLCGMVYRVAPQEEWRQIFADTWRWYRDFFYDKDMHGRDWKAIRAKYRALGRGHPLAPAVQLAALGDGWRAVCVAHLHLRGRYRARGPPPAHAVFTGLLGADLVPDPAAGLYRFEKIYGPTQYFTEIETPLSRPDVDLKEGDYLLAINGQTVGVPENYFRLLQVGKNDYVTITVGRGPRTRRPALTA